MNCEWLLWSSSRLKGAGQSRTLQLATHQSTSVFPVEYPVPLMKKLSVLLLAITGLVLGSSARGFELLETEHIAEKVFGLTRRSQSFLVISFESCLV